MAALVPTVAQAELISSLTQDEIPIKLRCAICSKLAVNAFRLPCCEQAVCENCQSSLPSSCPVCEHTPVAADDCKPNKSLRTTIRVFLRTEEKKREALRAKDLKDAPPATPLEVEKSAIATSALVAETPAPEVKKETSIEPATEFPSAETSAEQHGVSTGLEDSLPTEAEKDVPHQSIEEIAPGQEENITSDAQDAQDTKNYQDEQDHSNESGNAQVAGGMMQNPAFGMGFNVDPGVGAAFPGMGLMGQGGDLNQMQMMMAMQNGMMPNNFGAFPMGMPGMSMDPMAMQQMYMNGGFGGQGMGMNGMNMGMGMGMGMGGFDGGAGAGFNNGWNGQQWNIGQDNFNHPNATGMGNGDFGANNSGFNRHNAAGLTQGNFGQQNQYNDLQQNGYGHQGQGLYGRGRARGRGYGYGYGGGRGGHAYGHNMPISQQYPQNGILQPPTGPSSETGIPKGPKADTASAPPSNVDEFGREVRQSADKDNAGGDDDAKPKDGSLAAAEIKGNTAEDAPGPENTEAHNEQQSSTPKLNTAANGMSQVPALPTGFSSNGFAHIQSIGTDDYRWGGQGSLYNQAMPGSMLPPQSIQSIISVPDVPMNAPKGPKAMRDGLPNTSIYHLRGRGGFGMVGRGGLRSNGALPSEPTVVISTPKGSTPERVVKEDDKDRSPSRSRSRTRSPARSDRAGSSERREERHTEHRRQRHRSSSESEDEESRERRRERRRRHSKKYEDENDEPRDGAEGETKANGVDLEQSRDHSIAESRRSSHRSRRNRENEVGSEREYKSSSSHKHRSSHRSHRSRSPHRSHRDRDRYRDRSRDHARDKSRDRRHRRPDESPERSKADHDKEPNLPPVAEPAKEEIKIPRGPKAMSLASVVASNSVSNGIGIKGSARRQDDQARSSRKEENRNDKDRDTERSSRYHRDEQSSKTRTESSTRAPQQDAPKIPKGPKKAEADPHTLEREARNRERLLKEAQRIAGLAGGGSRKRSRDDDGPSRKRGRRSEVDGSGLEERIAKGESEREGARWG